MLVEVRQKNTTWIYLDPGWSSGLARSLACCSSRSHCEPKAVITSCHLWQSCHRIFFALPAQVESGNILTELLLIVISPDSRGHVNWLAGYEPPQVFDILRRSSCKCFLLTDVQGPESWRKSSWQCFGVKWLEKAGPEGSPIILLTWNAAKLSHQDWAFPLRTLASSWTFLLLSHKAISTL